jgi:dihydrofolate synthase/folylpolyglutamate synthase
VNIEAGHGDPALGRVEKALEERFPTRMVPDLDRITDLLDLLGQPQRAYPSIHLTGTNGKTTTARMVDALLRELGVRTGRYTSPHLQSVVERIAVDGAPLSPERFAEVYDEVAPLAAVVDARHEDRVTFFELLTAMAFAAFADAPIDVGVIEVGLGGRWDATNVLQAPVAVVTTIGLDHVGILGSTVEEIAAEKAGIIHDGATVVSALQAEPAADVLARRASAVGARLLREAVDFGVRSRAVAVGGQSVSIAGLGGDYDDLFIPLHGSHQARNAACALVAVEAFFGAGADRGPLQIDAVRSAFAGVQSPGRLEVVRRSPTVLLDGAHNPGGSAALAASLEESFSFSRLIGVVAVLGDKDVSGVLEALAPVLDEVVVTTNSSPRALSADELAAEAVEVFGDARVEVVERLDDALERAVELADEEGPGGGVVVTGSIVTVGDARALLGGGA